jgi:hypothetical protein
MANKDFPRGMWPISEGGSARPRCRTYPVAASKTIYKGSHCILLADGTVEASTVATGDTNIIGVAAHYVATGAGETSEIAVFDDPNQLFAIQENASAVLTQAAVGANAPFAANPEAGSSITRESTAELSSTAVAQTADLPLQIIGKVERIDNEWGEHVDLIVKFNTGQHIFNDDAGI